jgi:hypothetical protein
MQVRNTTSRNFGAGVAQFPNRNVPVRECAKKASAALALRVGRRCEKG